MSGTEPRVDVLGIHVSVTDMDHTLGQVSDWIETGEREVVCVSDVNALLNAAADPALTRLYNSSGLTVPDGMPLVWAGRRAGFGQMSRVCGPDLMPRLIELSAERGWSQYFYGGADGVAEKLADVFERKHPGLKVAGLYSPPFRPLSDAEDDEIVARINEAAPDIVWVGLGAPKQERWMAAHRDRLDAAVLIGVGAAFDFHTGRVKRAPVWMQRSGLEWAHRLVSEPRRLWRRYLFGIPRFVTGVLRRPPRPVPVRTD